MSNLSLHELAALITKFISRDGLNYSSHDNLLAAVQIVLAYLQQLYRMPQVWLKHTFCTHAVYRAFTGAHLSEGQPDMLSNLRAKFDAPLASLAHLFDSILSDDEARWAATCCSKCNRFLMIFALGMYFDPVKI